jgi:hypothetical protein
MPLMRGGGRLYVVAMEGGEDLVFTLVAASNE